MTNFTLRSAALGFAALLSTACSTELPTTTVGVAPQPPTAPATPASPAAPTLAVGGEMWIWNPMGDIVRIPVPDGAVSISPMAISEDGDIVGSVSYSRNGPAHAFIWTASNGYTMIAPAAYESEAADINDEGVVAGTIWPAGNSHASSRAFIWSRSQGLTEIADEASYTQAKSINNAGHIAGTRDLQPFLWSREKGFTMYAAAGRSPMREEGTASVGVAVNDRDEVLEALYGRYQSGIDYGWAADTYPSVWANPGSSILICTDCVVSWMNNRREVVGIIWKTQQAFKWTSTNGFQILPVDPAYHAEAISINDAGVTAGNVTWWGGMTISRAAVWNNTGVKLIDQIAGVKSTVVRDINNKGQILIYAR